MDAVNAFRNRSLTPEHPVLRGSAENGDIFFQHREACNKFYDAFPAIVEEYMDISIYLSLSLYNNKQHY